MRYKVKMTMIGEFPGSPDSDNYEVDEETFDEIDEILHKKGYVSENTIIN